jgi:hypothetical protein
VPRMKAAEYRTLDIAYAAYDGRYEAFEARHDAHERVELRIAHGPHDAAEGGEEASLCRR